MGGSEEGMRLPGGLHRRVGMPKLLLSVLGLLSLPLGLTGLVLCSLSNFLPHPQSGSGWAIAGLASLAVMAGMLAYMLLLRYLRDRNPRQAPGKEADLLVRQELALRQSEERFSLLVRSVKNYAIVLLDPDGRVVSWNDGAARITGYHAEEIVGRSFSEFYTPEEVQAQLPKQHLQMAISDRYVTYQGKRVRKDGSVFWADVALTPLFDEQQKLTGFAKVTRDITDRRSAEERIRESERLLAEAQRLARLGSWKWDTAANRVTWSDELHRIYGLQLGTFDGTFDAYLDRVHPEDRQVARAAVEQALHDHRPFEFEERIVKPDGSIRVLHSRGDATLDSSGQLTGLVGVCQDVTEQRRADSELRARMAELQAWHSATLGRESRILDLKREVNELLGQAGQPPRYASAASPGVEEG